MQKLQQYMQILQSKYMAMAAENYLDQVKKGTAQAQGMWPMMPQMAMGQPNQAQAGMPFQNFGAPAPGVGVQGFQMPNGLPAMQMGNLGQMNPMMGMNGNFSADSQFNGAMPQNFNNGDFAASRQ